MLYFYALFRRFRNTYFLKVLPISTKMARLIFGFSFTLLTLICFCQNGFAQNGEKPKEKDITSRISATTDFSVTKKFDFAFSQEVRLNQNLGKVNSHLTEASVGYKVFKWLNTGLTYRFTKRFEPEANNKHRLYGILGVEYQFEPIKTEFGARVRVEREWIHDEDGVEGDIRPRISAAYKNKNIRFEPGVSAEFFWTKKQEETKYVYSRYRLRAGLDYKITKHHEVSGYYAYQSEEKKKSIEVIHIIGLSYTYKLNLYKKGKKKIPSNI